MVPNHQCVYLIATFPFTISFCILGDIIVHLIGHVGGSCGNIVASKFHLVPNGSFGLFKPVAVTIIVIVSFYYSDLVCHRPNLIDSRVMCSV